MRIAAMLFLVCLAVLPARAQKINVNVNQDTFVLSNEAPGFLITKLINAGHSVDSAYQATVFLLNLPGTSAALKPGFSTADFLTNLANAPATSEIFTTTVAQVAAHGVSASISTDGSVRFDNVQGRTYAETFPVIQTGNAAVQNVRIVHSVTSQAPLNAIVVQGPLEGMTTTYNAFAVAWALPDSPQITLAGIGNAANYVAGKVAPGEIIVVYGSNFGPAALAQLQYANGVATTTIGSTRIYFDNVPAPMIYAVAGSPSSVLSCVVPYGVKTSTQVQVEYNSVKGNTLTVPVVDSVPGIFSINQSGTGPGAILNWPDYTINGSSNRVAAGGYIMAYGTGEGKTDIAIDGQKVPLLGPYPKPLLAPWTATVAGKPATVIYYGSAPDNIAGLFQVNVQIPPDLTAGIYDLVIKAGNFTSTAGLTVAVK